mmetsp:Transcript_41493/g.90345  ORF Transcript_41493/g.90345 Transcript_41493/m.90345 type:complete len:233 (+) Transcript_41493:2255-2953(+)
MGQSTLGSHGLAPENLGNILRASTDGHKALKQTIVLVLQMGAANVNRCFCQLDGFRIPPKLGENHRSIMTSDSNVVRLRRRGDTLMLRERVQQLQTLQRWRQGIFHATQIHTDGREIQKGHRREQLRMVFRPVANLGCLSQCKVSLLRHLQPSVASRHIAEGDDAQKVERALFRCGGRLHSDQQMESDPGLACVQVSQADLVVLKDLIVVPSQERLIQLTDSQIYNLLHLSV